VKRKHHLDLGIESLATYHEDNTIAIPILGSGRAATKSSLVRSWAASGRDAIAVGIKATEDGVRGITSILIITISLWLLAISDCTLLLKPIRTRQLRYVFIIYFHGNILHKHLHRLCRVYMWSHVSLFLVVGLLCFDGLFLHALPFFYQFLDQERDDHKQYHNHRHTASYSRFRTGLESRARWSGVGNRGL
jgi:hypothetical protein